MIDTSGGTLVGEGVMVTGGRVFVAVAVLVGVAGVPEVRVGVAVVAGRVPVRVAVAVGVWVGVGPVADGVKDGVGTVVTTGLALGLGVDEPCCTNANSTMWAPTGLVMATTGWNWPPSGTYAFGQSAALTVVSIVS